MFNNKKRTKSKHHEAPISVTIAGPTVYLNENWRKSDVDPRPDLADGVLPAGAR